LRKDLEVRLHKASRLYF